MSERRITLRDGRESDAEVLTSLVLRAKAHWGYDDQFMRAVEHELTMTPAKSALPGCRVAVDGDTVLGMCLVLGGPPTGVLEMLFVEPAAMGTGVGSMLLEDALDRARTAGITSLELDADPFAEPFYRRRGAVVIGVSNSGSIPGRTLSRMSFSTG